MHGERLSTVAQLRAVLEIGNAQYTAGYEAARDRLRRYIGATPPGDLKALLDAVTQFLRE